MEEAQGTAAGGGAHCIRPVARHGLGSRHLGAQLNSGVLQAVHLSRALITALTANGINEIV